MIAFFCDDCGKFIYRTTAGVVAIPPRPIKWGGHFGQSSDYHFCSRECRDAGVDKLKEYESTAAGEYELDRWLPSEPEYAGGVHA